MLLVTAGWAFAGEAGIKALSEQSKALSEQNIEKIFATSKADFKAEFVQIKTLASLNEKIKSSGRTSRSGDRLVWEVKHPSFLKVTMTSQEIVIDTGESKPEVFKLSDSSTFKGPMLGLSSLLLWLNPKAKEISEKFQIYQRGERSFTAKPLMESSLGLIEFTTDKGRRIQNFVFKEKSGDEIEITFKYKSGQ